MKGFSKASKFPGAGAKKVGTSSARAWASVCVLAGLLTACGGSGDSDITAGPQTAAMSAAEKSSSGSDGVALAAGGSGTTSPAPSVDAVGQTLPDGQVANSGQDVAEAAPTAQPVATAVNSLETIVNDMKLMNDSVLAGVPSSYGWSRGPGHVMMGNEPRGTNTPSWWQVDNSYFKSGAWWNAVLPWFVIFDGEGNLASNTRVEVRNMKLYMKSKSSGQWKLLNSSTGVGGENFPKSLQGSNVSTPDTRTEAEGSTSILPPGGDLVFHGWGGGFADIDGSDVDAIFLTLQGRLIKNNPDGADDRAASKYLIHVGGDYYPDRSTRVSDLAPAYYFPGIGVSRAKLVSNEWQAFNFSTIDVGVEDPGGATMTVEQLQANPPPLE
jgi:hypothetical protein